MRSCVADHPRWPPRVEWLSSANFPSCGFLHAEDFNFWRFNIDTVLQGTERPVHYFTDLGMCIASQQQHTLSMMGETCMLFTTEVLGVELRATMQAIMLQGRLRPRGRCGTPSRCRQRASRGIGRSQAVQPSLQVRPQPKVQKQHCCRQYVFTQLMCRLSCQNTQDMIQCVHGCAGKAPPPEWGGAAPAWWSLMRSHGQQPLHVLLRCGGQINADKVFEVGHDDHCEASALFLA